MKLSRTRSSPSRTSRGWRSGRCGDPVYADNLSRIIDFVTAARAADTAGRDPHGPPAQHDPALRADAVTETDQRGCYQQNAQAVESGLYLVPRVIE
jgi:aspartyl-tRNA(Asn)/glutamyl-tRNA(Gln) amidotransferase subunit C